MTGFARAHGLLDLAPDCDTTTLARRLARAGDAAPVVLTPAEEAAYNRITDRAVAIFHLDDPLARFLYHGR